MHSLKTKLESTIVYEIEHVFGRRVVSSRDCIELSGEIFKKTQQQLNPNTLRRFFSLVKAEYPPSQSTLNILSNYCGFQSIDDIYRVKNTQTIDEGSVNPDTILHFLVSLFKNTIVESLNDTSFLSVVMHSIKFLNANLFLTDKFQSLIAKTKNGNDFYFEHFVNVDKLNSFYGNGLRYYAKEKGTPESELFIASLYVLKYWLSGEDEKLLKCSAPLLNVDLSKSMPPLMQARHHAALLFYHAVTKTDSENTRIDIHNAYAILAAALTERNLLCNFTYIIAEALLLTGFYEEALYYIQQTKKCTDCQQMSGSLLDYSQSHNLVEAYTLSNLGYSKQAEKKFNEIKSSEFPFLNKRFSCIVYISLVKKIKPREKETKYDDQLAALINETGFKRLPALLL